MLSARIFWTQSWPVQMHGIGFRLFPSPAVVVARTLVLLLTTACSECEALQSSFQKVRFRLYVVTLKRGLVIQSRYMPTNIYSVDCEPSQSKDKGVQFYPFLQAYFNITESLTPTKAGRASPDTSQVPSTQETVPEEFLRFYM